MKTLGQIAFEAYHIHPNDFTWADCTKPSRRQWEVLAQAVRAAVIEECANVCERQQVNKSPDYFPGQQFDGACRTCAEAIRALKDKK